MKEATVTISETEFFPATVRLPHTAALSAAAVELAGLGFQLEATGAGKAPAMPKGYTTDFTVEEITATALAKVRSGAAPGLSVVLGARAAAPTAAGVRIPLAFELEGRAAGDSRWAARFRDAAQAVGADAVLNKLGSGWVFKTPSGGQRWMFYLGLPDAGALAAVLANLPARAARSVLDGKPSVMAELLTSRSIVPPSGGATHPTGRPWVELPASGGPAATMTLAVDELTRLSAAVAEVDEVADKSASSGTASSWWAALAGRACRTGRSFDAAGATAEGSLALLTSCGWRQVRTTSDGEVMLSRPGSASHDVHAAFGGPARPTGSLYVFTTSDAVLSAGFHSPFMILTATKYGGDADAAAESLIASGAVAARPEVLAIAHRRNVFPKSTDTPTLARIVLGALAGAENPLMPGVPLVFSRVGPTGAVMYAASLTSADTRRVWGRGGITELALAVVQPQRAGAETSEMLHELPRGVCDAVATALEAGSGGLRRVKYESHEPVLTREGVIVSVPGYHPEHQALVSIPVRDRQWWAKGYSVPARPPLAAAQTAFDFIRAEVLADFPFATPADEARAVLYFLACVGRPLINLSMGFGFDAPDRGTGKSLLAKLGRVIAQGTSNAIRITSRNADDVEGMKGLTAGVMAGNRFAHTDELVTGQGVDSKLVSEMLTATDGTVQSRALGGNQLVKLSGLMFTVCGNNVEIGADNNRRYLLVRIANATGTTAYLRTGFRHENLEAWVRAHRPELLAAAHTILLHGLQRCAAWPDSVPRPGSFTEFATTILGSLLHVLMPSGESAAAVAMGGWEKQTETHDATAEEWGPLLAWMAGQTAARPLPVKMLRDAYKGERFPPVLPDELMVAASDARMPLLWGLAFKRIRGKGIPYGTHLLRLVSAPRPAGSKVSTAWGVVRFNRITGAPAQRAAAAQDRPVSPDPVPITPAAAMPVGAPAKLLILRPEPDGPTPLRGDDEGEVEL